jgi:NADPH:quinone reductase-like Zn-dependent oxidoreductase
MLIIYALGHAANYSAGAFREFILADADLLIRIPDKLKYVNASALGMGVSTAAQALYQSLHLPLPTNTPIAGLKRPLGTSDASQILIYGASTATGAIAVQLAKL